jgi:biopolymer transport protein ExbD
MRSARALRAHEDVEHGELNIVPYLDILMNLIIFVLLSMSGLAAFGAVNVSVRANGAGDAEVAPPVLEAFVKRAGVSLVAQGEVFSALDSRAVTATAVRLKQTLPAGTRVVVHADREVEYAELIATLDALREDSEHHPLFADATLSP